MDGSSVKEAWTAVTARSKSEAVEAVRIVLADTNRNLVKIKNNNNVQCWYSLKKGQTPKSDIPPNIAPKIVTPEKYLQIWDSSATLIGQLAIVTLFGAILGGIPLSGTYPTINYIYR